MTEPTTHECGCVYRQHDASPGLRVCVRRCAEHEAMPVVPWDRELAAVALRKEETK